MKTQHDMRTLLATLGAECETTVGQSIVVEGLLLMDQNHGPDARCPKPFHNIQAHLLPMFRPAVVLAPVFDVLVEDLLMPIAWHDTIIEFDPPPEADPIGMIKRHRGARAGDKPSGEFGNEALSAVAMKRSMGESYLSTVQQDVAVSAVHATYPAFDFGPDFLGVPFETEPLYAVLLKQNPAIGELVGYLREYSIDRGLHVFQPHLEDPLRQGERVPYEALLLGLLDLGTVGTSPDPWGFVTDGNREYQELHRNLPSYLYRLLNVASPGACSDRARVANDMLVWRRMQPGFGVWQLLRFERIVYWLKQYGRLSSEQEATLRSTFRFFEENIRFAKGFWNDMEYGEDGTMMFSEPEVFGRIAEKMGYEV